MALIRPSPSSRVAQGDYKLLSRGESDALDAVETGRHSRGRRSERGSGRWWFLLSLVVVTLSSGLLLLSSRRFHGRAVFGLGQSSAPRCDAVREGLIDGTRRIWSW